jgi:glycosyltransferase involved in cell wall biosynthesis
METFLTFLILTYRRPEKAARLLRQFLDDRWLQLGLLDLEIVIADDHGEDETNEIITPVIRQLDKKGWRVRYVYRQSNMRGDRNLYYGYTRDSLGKFVWFLCDDDLIDVGEAIPYIKTVRQVNPLISMCGFVQGHGNQHGNFFGGEIRLIQDFSESVNYLIKFPKTTAYLMRRCPELNLDQIFERWDHTLFSWIGITIFLLAKKKHESVLIYPAVVARADNDYGLLRYSYRIFGKLNFVTQDSIEVAGKSFKKIKPSLVNLPDCDEMKLCLDGLHAHYSWRCDIEYTEDVLARELTFLRKNWLDIFRSKKCVVSFIKFILFFAGSYVFHS